MSGKLLAYENFILASKTMVANTTLHSTTKDANFSRNRAADGLIVTSFSDMKHRSIGSTICVSEDTKKPKVTTTKKQRKPW